MWNNMCVRKLIHATKEMAACIYTQWDHTDTFHKYEKFVLAYPIFFISKAREETKTRRMLDTSALSSI